MGGRTGKHVLVTGGAGGLGRATTLLLAGRGWHVFAADVDLSALERLDGTPNVTPVVLDVTDRTSFPGAVDLVSSRCDGLDGIVSFAGVLAVGSVIEIDEATLARVLDVNVLGVYRTNQAFFELVRARRGRIVVISSETGHQAAAPFNGPYSMSKHAIEAYADALRRELALLGLPVVKVQPGPFRTEMVAGIERRFTDAAAASAHFSDVLRRMIPRVAAEHGRAADPVQLAEVVHTALTTRRPKPAYRVRQDRQRALLDRLPTRLADEVLRRVLSRS